jgi:hypothetical protein
VVRNSPQRHALLTTALKTIPSRQTFRRRLAVQPTMLPVLQQGSPLALRQDLRRARRPGARRA